MQIALPFPEAGRYHVDMIIVVTTVPDMSEGESLAETIVEKRLAACVQIMPPMTSVYLWQGRLEKANEHLLLIKTLPEKFDDLSAFITANHSYSVPEIVALDAERVSGPYLEWMQNALTESGG